MIKKLRTKVFLVVFITLSILIIGAIGMFTFINYRNVELMGDRVFKPKPKDEEPPEISIVDKNKMLEEEPEEIVEIRKGFEEYKISHIKTLSVVSISSGIIGLIVVYVISRKVSLWIVKPVEETFEKQVQFISDASEGKKEFDRFPQMQDGEKGKDFKRN